MHLLGLIRVVQAKRWNLIRSLGYAAVEEIQ